MMLHKHCRNFLMTLACVAFASSCTASTSTSGDEPAPVGKVSAALETTGDAGMGYGSCREPACADVARGCDDVIRSGCGAAFLKDQTGNVPVVTLCSDDFRDAIAACTVATMSELKEVAEKSEEGAGETAENAAVDVLALEFAKCTRRATTCDQRVDCSRGIFIPGRLAVDAGTLAPPFQENNDPPPPAWSVPWKPNSKTKSLWSGAPWQSAKKVPDIDLMAGVDSLSCAQCAVERCPTFAYRCFSAENDTNECAGGDCCHSLRKCVESCGGYKPSATKAMFYTCMSQCAVSRPRAPQELADLQKCAQTACAGCEAYDHPGSAVRN